MCHSCDSNFVNDVHQNLQSLRLHDRMKKTAESAQANLKGVLVVEDVYRNSGVRYHQTNMATRQPLHYEAEHLERMKQAFESDYNIVFSQVNDLLPKMRDIHREIIACQKSRDCFTKRSARFYEEILPVYNDLAEKFTDEATKIRTCCLHAEDLSEINDELWQEAVNRRENVQMWYAELYGAPDAIPQAPEWNIWVSWVAGLPETQRAMAGRPLFSIAKQMILARVDDSYGEAVDS
ncbi:hypothetical protein IAQ61_006949 [Plenodomus lingam]|uniref:Predicted protein n=1 Tax=Leptosphaeria maculans (strain JN3 / isolate v23.1.3 / race Av1-4-5-6-7-8) TaxID=985895 RepID=E5AD11_LEPMJ|nr:predicted protein [Plenodomus lingam JN3]KAH9869736.1 hypothetical protein IAQ61_006949 [Plenodomus lingam]CBY02363.1 predicted protein [Plenodomus lingam JN3]